MITDWEQAIQFVLKMEGEYTLDPNDPGGETKFGISKKSYPNLDIKSLTVERAREIYYQDFWTPCCCNDLPTDFAISTFDCAVNQGVTIAKRLLQISLDVSVDGIIGPKTLAAAAKGNRSLLKKLLALRLAEYARLMAAKQHLFVFAVNWCNRVLSLFQLLLSIES